MSAAKKPLPPCPEFDALVAKLPQLEYTANGPRRVETTRIESELERRWQIRIERSGAVLIVDTAATMPDHRDGVLLFSTREHDLAEAAVAAVAVRCRDGNGWVLRWPWHGGLRDEGELTAKLAHACVEESARRGAR